MPQRKPSDTPATLLAPHAPSPGGTLLLPSQGISSGCPGCCDAFVMPCPPKQPTVYYLGFWDLHSPKGNSQRWLSPKVSSAATHVLSWLLGRNWVLLEDPFLTTEEGHVKIFHICLYHVLFIHSGTSFTPSYKNEDMSPLDWTHRTKPWCRKDDGLPAPSEHFPSPHGTFEHKSCSSGGCTAPRCWRFPSPWRGYFCARSQRATGGNALLLSVR